MEQTLIDGRLAAQIPIDDRGLAYGDGVFETLAVAAGVPLRLERHLARLVRGCERLRLPIDGLLPLLRQEAAQLSQAVNSPLAVLKIMVTRGSAGRGYAVDPNAQPRRILRLLPAPQYPSDYLTTGIRLGLCQTRLAINPALAGIKHLNRLEQVLGRSELAADEPEGVMLDTEGAVIEGTCTNLFLVQQARLVTPLLDRCGIAGIAREVVLEAAAQQGVGVDERPVSVADLEQASAVFVTNSLIGAWPVREFQSRSYDSIAWAQRARSWLTEATA